MIRVVYDTNVLISGLLWRGVPHRLLRLVDEGAVCLCLNESMLQEFSEVIQRPVFFPHLEKLGAEGLDLVTLVMEKAHLYQDIRIPLTIHDDPDDDWVLACAVASGAHYIVSGDRHLLRVGQFGRTRIVSPAQALDLFGR